MEIFITDSRRILYLIIFVTSLFLCTGCSSDEKVIINRYRNYLFDTSSIDSTHVTQWSQSLDSTGRWSDIDYSDQERANWKVKNHLSRLRTMSLAWASPGSPRYHDNILWGAINKALNHWLQRRYQNSNWWHNEIGVPQYMRDIIILLEDKLSDRQKKGALEVLDQFRIQKSGAGANLIWSADLGLHYALLTHDEELMKRCRKLILEEINITKGEGVQPDFSFHQHGSRLQMYQYGRAFLLSSVRIAWETKGTSLAFPEDKTDILTNFVIKGWQWMARGLNTVPGTIDRSASRKGELRSADIRGLIPYLCEIDSQHVAIYKDIAQSQNGKEESLSGFKYYPYSDFSAYHQKKFSFFLKTISSRTQATESFNGENLKGKLLNSGDGYLISDGEEYYNLMPVWDWTRLPGVTGFKGADHVKRKPFVGSVSDGTSGLTAMSYNMTGNDSTQFLSAHKVWVRHGNIIVVLIAGIKTNNVHNFFTALDQCRWQGDVTVNKPGNVLHAGNHKLNNVRWIHQKNFAYISLSPSSFNIQLTKRTGRWTSINTSESDVPVSEKVFLPLMLHTEQRPTGYILAYAQTPRKTMQIIRNPPWQILQNNSDCQAVRFKDGSLMASFFFPGTLSIRKFHSLSVDKSCLILATKNKLYVSDPTHHGGPVEIKLKEKKPIYSNLPDDGTTVEIDL